MMRKAIDPEKCTGCALCSSLCPHMYAMDRGKAFAILNHGIPRLGNCCWAAVRACPGNEIALEEEWRLLNSA